MSSFWSLWSEKTFLMSTPKCLGVQIFRFTWVKLMNDLPPSIKLLPQQLYMVYSFTFYPASYVVIWCSATGQVSHIYKFRKFLSISRCCCCAFDCILLLLLWITPLVNWSQMPCIPLHCFYIYIREMNPLVIQAQRPCILLHCLYIYRREMNHLVNWSYMPCIPLHCLYI